MNDKTLKYKEAICKFMFDDSYDNVIKNLKIVNYAYQNNLIERKDEYKALIKVFSLLSSNNVEVIKNFEPKEVLTEVLYDAYKDTQTSAFESIKQSLYTFNESQLDESLSKNNVKVYNIKKNNSKLLICTSRINRHDKELPKMLHQNIGFRTSRKIVQDFKSLSFIDNSDIKSYRNLNDFVTFVYPNNIPNEYLITISKEDAYTEFTKEGLPTSRQKPYYKESSKLLNSTTTFNEVAILRSNQYLDENAEDTTIKPVAIFCLNKITPLEYEIAKELNIDIIYSESKYVYDENNENLPRRDQYFKDDLSF